MRKTLITITATAILAFASFLMVILVGNAPASATISFCHTAKGSPCISPVNGCSLTLGGGGYAFAENGDTVIAGDGSKHVCVNGKWVKTAALGVHEVQTGPNLGRGVIVQGPPGSGGVDCNVQITCPPPIFVP